MKRIKGVMILTDCQSLLRDKKSIEKQSGMTCYIIQKMERNDGTIFKYTDWNERKRKMILHFIRHGKTAWNLKKRISGVRVDVPLAEEGIREIQRLVEKGIYPENPGTCYTSCLIRTAQTLRTIYPGVNYTETPLLNERDFGPIETERNSEKIIAWRKSLFDEYGNENEEMFGDGECTSVFSLRVEKDFNRFLEHCFKKEEKRVTVCGHGAFLRQIGQNYGISELGSYKNLVYNGMGLTFCVENKKQNMYKIDIAGFIGGYRIQDVMKMRKSEV